MSKATERVGIQQDERWPDYSLEKPSKYAPTAEVDAETLSRWRAAIQAYDVIQAEMSEVFHKAQSQQKREAEIAKAEKEAAEAQKRLDALRGTA